MCLSGTDLCSEYQSHVSPAFLMTPLGWLTGSFNFTTAKPNWPSSPSPSLSRFPISENGSSVSKEEMLESYWHVPLSLTISFPGYFSNIFITLQLHCHHPFQTTMVSWRGCSCGLLAGLPTSHSWLPQPTSTLEWALKNTNRCSNTPRFPSALRIIDTDLTLAHWGMHRSDPCQSL